MSIIAPPIATAWDLNLLQTYDSSVRFRALLELAIVRKVCTDLIAKGLQIAVNSGDVDDDLGPSVTVDNILSAVFAVDEAALYIYNKDTERGPFGVIELVLGNGPHVITDYTVTLTGDLQPANDYANELTAWQ